MILLDLRSANTEGDEDAVLRLMGELSRAPSHPPMVVLCEEDNRKLIFRAIEHGADDSVTNPPNMIELRLILRRAHRVHAAERELQRLRANERPTGRLHELLGTSAPMQELFGLVRKIAPCDVNVLITGETGTGKELLARAIHQLSSRTAGPLVAFSCANLPENLVEDELFGHEKGAFTGAMISRPGPRRSGGSRHAVSSTRSAIWDSDCSLSCCACLQERSFERLGSNKTINVDIRLICATNRNLGRNGAARQIPRGFVLPPECRAVAVCLRCASAATTFRCWRNSSCRNSRCNSRRKRGDFRNRRWRRSKNRTGPGTCANWKMSCSAPSFCRKTRPWTRCTCPRPCAASESRFLSPTSPIEPNLSHSYEDEVRRFKRSLLVRALREAGWRKAECARNSGRCPRISASLDQSAGHSGRRRRSGTPSAMKNIRLSAR